MSGVCIGCVFLGYPSTGGGAAGVSSFAGRTDVVVPEAGDYAAFYEPIGASAAAVAAHVALADPHAAYYLTDGSKIITGNVGLAPGKNIVGAATIAATVAVNAPLHSGVALTAAGAGSLYLADDGTYKTTPDAPTVVERFEGFVLGSGAAYANLRSWSIPTGEAISIVGSVQVFRGPDPDVQPRSFLIELNAERGSGNAVPTSSASTHNQNGVGPVVQVNWIAGPGADEVTLQLRDNPDSLSTVVLTYTIAREVAPS